MKRLVARRLLRPATLAALLFGAPDGVLAAQDLATTGPAATVTGAANRATVAWSYAGRLVIGYQVMRREIDRSGKPVTAWAQVAAAAAGPFADVLSKPSVIYEYRVDAALRGGTLVPGSPVQYAAPAFTTATNVKTAGTTAQVTITWTAATSVTGYHVFRRLTRKDGSVAEHIQRTTTPITTTSFADVIPLLGELYDYNVVSMDPAGVTYHSDWAQYFVPAPLVAPVVTIVGVGDKAELNWSAPAGVQGYNVVRTELDASGMPTGKTLEVARMTYALTFSDPLPNPAAGYRYRVVGITAEGKMTPAAELDFVAPPFTTPAIVMVSGAGGRVALSWAAGGGVAGFHVMRRIVNPDGTVGSLKQMTARYLNTTSFIDALPTPGLIYEYQVVGVGMDLRQWPSAWVRHMAGKW